MINWLLRTWGAALYWQLDLISTIARAICRRRGHLTVLLVKLGPPPIRHCRRCGELNREDLLAEVEREA